MRRLGAVAVLGLSAYAALAVTPSYEEVPVVGLTPIITVESIEPCLSFWTEGLGFVVTATVPGEGPLAFAALQNGAVELMYQTRASIDADLGASGAPSNLGSELAQSTTTLFVQVEALEPVIEALGDVEVVVPRRQTEYGMDEIFVRAPCGTLVGLAAPLGAGE